MSRDPERESRFLAALVTFMVFTLLWIAMIVMGFPKRCQKCQQDSNPVTDRRGK